MSPDEKETSRMNSAIRFSGGDIDKARQMVAGQYFDIAAVKCRFVAEDADFFGAFVVFANIADQFSPAGAAATLNDKMAYDKISPRDNWKAFYVNLQRVVESSGNFSLEMRQHIVSSFEGFDLYPDIESANIGQVTTVCEDIIKKFLGFPKVLCDIEIEKCTSLALSEEKIPLTVKGGGATVSAEDTRPEIEKEADFVFEGKFIVSPVKGKYVNDILPGEIIKVLPLKDEPIAKRVALAQKALSQDGTILPLRARFREKIPADKGNILYCLVAKKILVKIREEENVKIEVESAAKKNDESEKAGSLYVYVVLLVAIILVFFLILYALF